MSYENINELPKSVRNLPKHAKNLYLKAFNSAWEENDEPGSENNRDKLSHEAAWSAVKLEYEKDKNTGEWIKKGETAGRRSRHTLRHHRRGGSSSSSQTKAPA